MAQYQSQTFVRWEAPATAGSAARWAALGNAVALGLVGAAFGGGLGFVLGRLSGRPSPVAHHEAQDC
jgi:hypothetical protein